VSRTFEGRDRFAPAAAWLAKGVELSALGRPVHDFVMLALPAPEVAADKVHGEVLRVDRFGNLVTNVDRRTFEKVSGVGAIEITIGTHPVGKLVATYAEAGAGEICALFGSTDHLEIAANGASAAERLGLARGAPVDIRRT
jgi:S-adenosylmethionine hydrolase